MARLTGPDEGSRFVYRLNGNAMMPAVGAAAVFYTDAAGTTLADIRDTNGNAVASTLTVDTYSRLPLFQLPDGVDTVYVSVAHGPLTPVYARTDDRLDALVAGAAAEVSARAAADAAALVAANGTYAPLGHKDYVTSGGSPVMEWAQSGDGAIFHLLAGTGFTGPYLVGIGVDHDNAVGVTVSVKANSNTGLGINLESTSGAASYGVLGSTFGPGKLVELRKAGGATGALVSLRNDYGGTGDILEWGVTAGQISGYIDAAGALVVQNDSATPHLLRLAPSGGGANVVLYHYSGTPTLYFPSAIQTSSNHLLFRSGGAATIGAESLSTLLDLQNGNSIGFFGATPVTKPTGVAVTAAGVHAALVSLGLIAA